VTGIEGGNASVRTGRILAGTTILQAVPALNDDRVGRAALNFALGQLRSGARAIIAGGGGQLVGELQAVGGEWMDFDLTVGRPLKRRRNLQAFRELLAAERVEVVHAHGSETTRSAVAGARDVSVPSIATCYGLPPPRSSTAFRADPLSQADAVLAPSEFAADLIARHRGVAPERLGVIPPVVDTAWFDPAAVRADRVAAVRHEWQVGHDERIILAAGASAPASGHLTLVDAVRILVNGGLREVVFVIGAAGAEADDYAQELDARIGAQGLGAMVRRVRPCRDMPAAYAAADAVVVATERKSAFEEDAAEAVAMARPVIASNIGSLPEIVLAPPRVAAENRIGWLMRPRDPLDLARALAGALMVELEDWHALGSRARQFAERKFSERRVTDATLAVYGALLGADSAGSLRR
jgi:glycosyltransferase involved in cell wall biosynthesis